MPDYTTENIENAINAYSLSETVIRRKEEAIRRLDIEYNKEFQRVSLIDGKARTMGVTLLSILTLFMNLFPLSGILLTFNSGTAKPLLLAEVITLLFFVAAALFWSVRVLLRLFEVLKIQNYSGVEVSSVIGLADSSEDGYDKFIANYAKCVCENRDLNSEKLMKIKTCYMFFLVIFATLLITTILLKDLCPMPKIA
ncbi:hypothetical protein FACS189490_01170 [Clostridia bacterium]|nr:hypothetical protein FACS189490_01170 [Clostridia bacterium]